MAVPLLDTVTAAKALGVSRATIHRMVTDGLLKNHGTGRKIRLHWKDLADAQATRPRVRRRLLDRLDKVTRACDRID